MKNIPLLLILLLLACNNYEKPIRKGMEESPSQSTKEESFKEIWGERHQIVGDFNGDGRVDTLKETFISSLDNKETNKFYENLDYESVVTLTALKKPLSRLGSTSKKINDLEFTSRTGQLFGVAYLKNEGDLDGNGTDEIGLVVDWADFSNLNSYRLYSYKNDSWKLLLTFKIDESDLSLGKDGAFLDTTFVGFLLRDNKGRLIAKTYEHGDAVMKVVDLKKKNER